MAHPATQIVPRAAAQYLAAAGIPTEIYYSSPLHLERAYAYLGHKADDFPAAEAASREALALPIFAELTEPQQRAVVERIASFSQAATEQDGRNDASPKKDRSRGCRVLG